MRRHSDNKNYPPLEANQRDDRAGGIGEVIHGICCDGHRACQRTHSQLSCEQKQVAQNADDTGQNTDCGTGLGVGGIFCVPDEEGKEYFGHKKPPNTTKSNSTLSREGDSPGRRMRKP